MEVDVRQASTRSESRSFVDATTATSDGDDHIHRLAACLFELRGLQEVQIYALTSIQRSLERVRCPNACHGEADLLLGEMGRLLKEADETSASVAGLRLRAAELIQLAREERAGLKSVTVRQESTAEPTAAPRHESRSEVDWNDPAYVAAGGGG